MKWTIAKTVNKSLPSVVVWLSWNLKFIHLVIWVFGSGKEEWWCNSSSMNKCSQEEEADDVNAVLFNDVDNSCVTTNSDEDCITSCWVSAHSCLRALTATVRKSVPVSSPPDCVLPVWVVCHSTTPNLNIVSFFMLDCLITLDWSRSTAWLLLVSFPYISMLW